MQTLQTMPRGAVSRFAAELADRAVRASLYAEVRHKYPSLPARLAFEYAAVGYGESQSMAAFVCERTRGHSWSYSGTAYGGDDESYGGEGRCYCAHCGADGDA